MNRIKELFGIQYPIIQAGMIWCSGWELASAVSNAGGLGIIGAGSMYPEVLRDQILKCKAATDRPFAVNVPLLYPSIEEHMVTIVELGVPIVFTSAGNPKTWTEHLKSHGIRVAHVVSSVKFALKAQAAGVDAVVAEGFEAGGHNGKGGDNNTLLGAFCGGCARCARDCGRRHRRCAGDCSGFCIGCRRHSNWQPVRGHAGIFSAPSVQERGGGSGRRGRRG